MATRPNPEPPPDRSVTEQRVQVLTGGARNMGSFVPLASPNVDEDEAPPTVKTLHTTTDRCSDCRWPQICAEDVTCWDTERRLLREVDAYRKREKLEALAVANGHNDGDDGDNGDNGDNGDGEVVLHPVADAQADEILDSLADGVASGVASGVTVELPREPHEAGKRLLESLGASYTVKGAAGSKRRAKRRGGKPKVWTREKIIAAIQAFAAEHGRPPTSTERPSMAQQSKREFGSWADAVEAAGFAKPTRGTRYPPLEGAAVAPPQPPAASSNGQGVDETVVTGSAENADTAIAGDTGGTHVSLVPPTPVRPAAPTVRAAVLNLIDAARALAEAILPEETIE